MVKLCGAYKITIYGIIVTTELLCGLETPARNVTVKVGHLTILAELLVMCKSLTVRLISVTAAPVFRNVTIIPHDVNVTEGDSVSFYCGSYAEPEASVVWMQNGIELNRE